MVFPLTFLKEGETGQIVGARGGSGCHRGYGHGRGRGCQDLRRQDYLQNMGIRPGKLVWMVTNKGTGPIVLRIDEIRIAIGRGAAMKIYVRRIEK